MSYRVSFDSKPTPKTVIKRGLVWLLNLYLTVVVVVLTMALFWSFTFSNRWFVEPDPHYPTRPITIIVPFAAGGISDMLARSMEMGSVKYIGQPLVVTNMPGGGATLGWNELARTKPDGYTIGIVSNGALLQPLYGKTRYHYPSALEPLVQIASMPIVLAVLAEDPWNNLDELVNYAKQHPDELKFSHPGLGTGNHVMGEMLAQEAGISIVQVPFQGDSEALAALLGGHVQLLIISPAAIKEYVKVER